MLSAALRPAVGFVTRYFGRRAAYQFVSNVARRAARRGASSTAQYWRGVHASSEEAAAELLGRDAVPHISEHVIQGIGATAGAFVLSGGVYAAYEANMVPPKRGPHGGWEPPNRRQRRDDPGYPGPFNPNTDSHPGTVGLVRTRYHSNRKDYRKFQKIVAAAEKFAIHSYRGLNQWNSITGTNRGYNSLAMFRTGGTTVTQQINYPIHIFNLTAIPNDLNATTANHMASNATLLNANPYVAFNLVQSTTVGVTPNPRGAALRFDPFLISGLDSAGNNGTTTVPTNPSAWVLEQLSDVVADLPAGNGFPTIGRNHYLDWLDIRMMVYGKRKHDTEVTMRLVKFTEDKFCPEFFHIGGGSVNQTWFPQTGQGTNTLREYSDATDMWKGLIDGLVNNPIANRPAITQRWYRTLFKKKFVISSKDTTDANTDVNVEMFKFFKRYGWMRNHAQFSTAGETDVQLLNEQDFQIQRQDFGAQPSRLKDNVYLLITAKTPHDYGGGVLTDAAYQDYQNSYDLIIRKKLTYDLGA